MSFTQFWYTLGYFRILPTDEAMPYIETFDPRNGEAKAIPEAEALLEQRYGNAQPEGSLIALWRVQLGPCLQPGYPYYCCRHGHSLSTGTVFSLKHSGCLVQGPFPDDDEIEEYTPGWKLWKARNLLVYKYPY